MLIELLKDEKVLQELNWSTEKAYNYTSLNYELKGEDLQAVADVLKMTIDKFKEYHLQDLVKILYTEGTGFYVTPEKTIWCNGCKVIEFGKKVRLYGPTTVGEFYSLSRALEYLVRFIRKEINL